jgi:hypothetical protein
VPQRSPYHIVEEQKIFEAEDAETFSRIDFAMRVLAVLRPDFDVTVYRGARRLEVQRPLRWMGDAGSALVAIPPRASRYGIAYALAELAGKAHHPYVIDLVVAAGTHATAASLAD